LPRPHSARQKEKEERPTVEGAEVVILSEEAH